MPRYKHADILRAVADAAESSETPWDVVEFQCGGEWTFTRDRRVFFMALGKGEEMRIKPKTRIINGTECPEALRVAPKRGTKVWVESITYKDHCFSTLWGRDYFDYDEVLARGIVHLCEENAVICCKARLGEGE